ncbi:putative thiol peroxidase [Sulfurimonas gotlandica GD1]|jgi:thiol peroxidase|uniref:Putative thiol peroxidase n=1 Tax=Sulfurimonas gotlandica (strain DSM 19862 / JCM 16533 / GD1) TaxID=929558 RepID=B6BJ79_SULGG|nr:thiol peroxidase [Sulfurimonas gotlandica]EDZ63399.1 thiol peroxidase [Sulfurimonas gotlandica GD1]EHP30596.1 putative thiol peroxidase [Sulfurimonas gotlandica GD1]
MQTTTFNGTTVNLAGTPLNVGDAAPSVIATGTDLNDVEIGGAKDRIQLIITVPSLDTDTCAAETRRFNVDVNNLDICETTVISMDLPFAADRFCTTEGIENLTVASDYINKDVSKAFGVLMDDNKLKGLSARAVFVIDRSGIITYKEIVSEVTAEPNYEAALEAIKEAR